MTKRLPRLPYVERGEPADTEPGCIVYSKTMMRGDWPRGGVVIELRAPSNYQYDHTGDLDVVILEWEGLGGGQYPSEFVIPLGDVEPESMTFFARDAAGASQRLTRWLSKQNVKENRGALVWMHRAAGLAAIAVTGLYTPEAELRYEQGTRAGLKPCASCQHRQSVHDQGGERIACALCDCDSFARNTPAV